MPAGKVWWSFSGSIWWICRQLHHKPTCWHICVCTPCKAWGCGRNWITSGSKRQRTWEKIDIKNHCAKNKNQGWKQYKHQFYASKCQRRHQVFWSLYDWIHYTRKKCQTENPTVICNLGNLLPLPLELSSDCVGGMPDSKHMPNSLIEHLLRSRQ